MRVQSADMTNVTECFFSTVISADLKCGRVCIFGRVKSIFWGICGNRAWSRFGEVRELGKYIMLLIARNARFFVATIALIAH